MGILSKEYICPEVDCPNIEEGKKGQVCHECGTEFKKMTSFQAKNLRSFKVMNKKEPDIKTTSKNDLVSDETSDEEMKTNNYINNLSRQEINVDWEKLESKLSSGSEEAQIIGLKAIIEQNKLIIQQNELIYLELKKINEKSK